MKYTSLSLILTAFKITVIILFFLSVPTTIVISPFSKPAEIFKHRTELERKADNGGIDAVTGARKLELTDKYGMLPLSFEMNQGQADPKVKFLSRGSGYGLFLTAADAVLSLNKSTDRLSGRQERTVNLGTPSRQGAQNFDLLRMKLVGANPSSDMKGEDELKTHTNYFAGNDGSRWQSNIRNYGRVKMEQVYPRIDLLYYGNQRELEYDFVVNPGGDPKLIRLSFPEARSIRLDKSGDLIIRTKQNEIKQHKPIVYQESENGKRDLISGRFLVSKGKEVGFEVDTYDVDKPLVIDPTLVYSSFLGGSGYDDICGIAVDREGNSYLTGSTGSMDFPVVSASFQTEKPSGHRDVFVAKMNSAGTELIYSTYLIGDDFGVGLAIALDRLGDAYITGKTFSDNFPIQNPLQATGDRAFGDAFVVKLNPNGSRLLYSTYLGGHTTPFAGGSSDDTGESIAVDFANNAYVGGIAASADFPTVNALQSTRGSTAVKGFITKINETGSNLIYSTYLGGSGFDEVKGIAVDGTGNAYLVGLTDSRDFPTTGAVQAMNAGGFDAFVSKLNSTGSALVYSTYIGGAGRDEGHSIAIDPAGNVYVTGQTNSTDFPTTLNAFQSINHGGLDAFVTKLDPEGCNLIYSTYLGGAGDENFSGGSIAVDLAGNAYVAGDTTSTDFPLRNAFQSAYGGGYTDLFVTKLNSSGTALIYSSYLGGNLNDYSFSSNSIAVDSFSNAYVTGLTESRNFPTVAADQGSFGGGESDGFLVKIRETSPVIVTPDSRIISYGDPEPMFTYSSSGLFGLDALTGVSCSVAGAHIDVGAYTITCSGNTNENYLATYVAGTLTVMPKMAIVTANDKMTNYGDPDPTFTYVASGLIGTESFSGISCSVAIEHISAGTYPITCLGNGNENYSISYVAGTLTVVKASTTTKIICSPMSLIYTGADLTPCSVTVTGSGLSLTLAPSYNSNVAVGIATAIYAFHGDDNHAGSNGSASFIIEKAATSTIVTCPVAITYNALPQTPCSATVTGPNLSLTPSPLNFNNRDAGIATSSYNYAGDANHLGSADNKNFTINKAVTHTTVTFAASPYVFRGTSYTATAMVAGVGSLSQTLPVVYGGDCIYVSTVNGCSATATYSESANYLGSTDSKAITIFSGCSTFDGFKSPIGGAVELLTGGNSTNPIKTFKLGSTIPIIFGATCFGSSLISGIHVLHAQKWNSATLGLDEPIDASPTDAATTGVEFRLTGTEWHYNLDTKGSPGFSEGIWLLRATLYDGSSYTVWIGLKK